MTATAETESPQTAPLAAVAPSAPDHEVGPDDQMRAEHTFTRSAFIGAGIGAVVCAGLWVGMVAIAAIGKGYWLPPIFAIAAGCGVFAGIFLGGWAGAMVGTRALEDVHHRSLPPAP